MHRDTLTILLWCISSTICQYFTSIIPEVHYVLVQHCGQPNDDKDYWRSWEKRRETAATIQQHTIHGKRAHMCYHQQQRERVCDLHLYICNPLTPSKNEEAPPLLVETTKHHYQHKVGHDAFTQHLAEGRQEEVLWDGRDRLAGSLKFVLVLKRKTVPS